MYTNFDFELLKNNKNRFSSDELNELIASIENFYLDFNKKYEKYTQNYITTMTNLMNNYIVKNLIDSTYGGTLHISQKVSEDLEKIIVVTKEYSQALEELKYLSFLSEEKRNVVFVGPNGCGKTTLLRHLISLTGENDISYFQADRLLLIDKSYNPERDEKQFQTTLQSTYRHATNVDTGDQGYYINKQLNQMIALFEKKRSSELEQFFSGKLDKDSCETEFVLKSWNMLIKDRELYCDGTLKVRMIDGEDYEIKYLSSGEKNIFYFLSSIILQDEKKYYFIDEPENNLNPSVVTQLWDIIEKYRPNSIFVYLTHDNEFVSTRINSKIYWIRKYDGKVWAYESLPENDNLPQKLMVSLIGNKQSVIFCESEDEEKYDSIVFKLMFPSHKIVSSGGCTKVISKVKAYRQAGLPQSAYGIIDCDYRKQDFLDGQKKHNVFYMPFFEIENFLFCEEILKAMIENYSKDPASTFQKVFSKIKSDFIKKKERFIIRNVATRLHELGFSDGIKKLKTRQELKDNYNKFVTSVNLDNIFEEYENLYNDIIEKNDLNTILRYYDNKNILTDFDKVLDFRDGFHYEESVLTFLKENDTLLLLLREKYLKEICN